MYKELISSGHEHIVYRSNFKKYALKRPTFTNQVAFWLYNFDPKIIEDEYREADQMVEGSTIRTPRWRVFTHPERLGGRKPYPLWKRILTRKKYLVGQEFIEEDNSVDNIKQVLQEQNQDHLVQRFISNRSNFITRNGEIFYIDPTKGIFIAGLLDRLGIIPKSQVLALENKFLVFFRKVLGKPWD